LVLPFFLSPLGPIHFLVVLVALPFFCCSPVEIVLLVRRWIANPSVSASAPNGTFNNTKLPGIASRASGSLRLKMRLW